MKITPIFEKGDYVYYEGSDGLPGEGTITRIGDSGDLSEKGQLFIKTKDGFLDITWPDSVVMYSLIKGGEHALTKD
jgi:hypothetical protein